MIEEIYFFYYIVIYIKASSALYWFHGCNVDALCLKVWMDYDEQLTTDNESLPILTPAYLLKHNTFHSEGMSDCAEGDLQFGRNQGEYTAET